MLLSRLLFVCSFGSAVRAFLAPDLAQELLKATDSAGSESASTKNFAAWIPAEKSQLAVKKAKFPKPGKDELVIKSQAVAINPVDWKIQTGAAFSLDYPAIIGEDVAGEVLEVGSGLEDKFEVGQRVIAHTLWANGNAYGGFQLYPLAKAATTAVVPDDVPIEEAVVMPLSISTAAAGLFMSSTLGLDFPGLDSGDLAAQRKDKTPTLLLWGGSSSVGSSVIQLASAAGYDVVTTASSSNYQYCKDLGATYVIDYHNPDVIPILIALLKSRDLVGVYDAIGSDQTVRQSAAVLHALGGGKIASVGATPDKLPKNVKVGRIGSGNIVTQEPKVAKKVWGEYVPAAFKSGKLVASPKPLIVGEGLESVQKGLDRQKEGVSARKVVVLLE